MTAFKCCLTKREEVAENTMAFHFERPQGFQFKAGQFVDLTILNPPKTDNEGSSRTFTIASPPFEKDLVIATRMRGTAFKESLELLPLGTEMELEGPMGSFTLHHNTARPAVFLAGGIGITPFLSIIRQAGHDESLLPLCLFYSNRRPEDAAFLNLLYQEEKKNTQFRFIPTMTAAEKSQWKWKGETGYINGEMLARHKPQGRDSIFYIAGPPAMVAALRETLMGAAINEDDIRSEEFGGY